MTYPPDRYSDLREGKPNPDIDRLVVQLDALGQQFAQSRMSTERRKQIANLLYEQAVAHPRSTLRSRRRGVWSVRRAVLVGAGALAVIVALSGATLAIGGAIGFTFPWNYSFLQSPQANKSAWRIPPVGTRCGCAVSMLMPMFSSSATRSPPLMGSPSRLACRRRW